MTHFINLVCKKEQIYLIKGIFNNKNCWYYMRIDNLKFPILIKNCSNKLHTINLLNYGKVLDYGWGLNPPLSIQKKY